MAEKYIQKTDLEHVHANKFLLRVPYKKETKDNLERDEVIAIDEGERKFLNCYMPNSSNLLEISVNDKINFHSFYYL